MAEHDAFGDEEDAGVVGGDVFEADLVADFVAEACVAFLCDAGCEHACGDAAGLEDDDLLGWVWGVGEGLVEEELGDLGGFAGACGGADDGVADAWCGWGEPVEDGLVEGVDGEVQGKWMKG